jgi:hypothetical protein
MKTTNGELVMSSPLAVNATGLSRLRVRLAITALADALVVLHRAFARLARALAIVLARLLGLAAALLVLSLLVRLTTPTDPLTALLLALTVTLRILVLVVVWHVQFLRVG